MGEIMSKKPFLLAALMLFYHCCAVAQSSVAASDEVQGDVADKRSAESKKGRGYIEEVIVTVQRREQSLQDVPVTVSVFSGDDLVSANISSTRLSIALIS